MTNNQHPTTIRKRLSMWWTGRRCLARTVTIAAAVITAAGVSGCGGGYSSSSSTTYTNTGLTQITVHGSVVDVRGAAEVGHTVQIDDTPGVLTDNLGQFTTNLPAGLISPTANTFRVFDPQGRLEFIEGIKLPEACCVTLAPFVVGPPKPP